LPLSQAARAGALRLSLGAGGRNLRRAHDERACALSRRQPCGGAGDTQTLWDQLQALQRHLLPTYEALHAHVPGFPVIGADETVWPLLEKSGAKRWYAWSITTPEAVFYRVDPSRSAEAAARTLLGDYTRLFPQAKEVFALLGELFKLEAEAKEADDRRSFCPCVANNRGGSFRRSTTGSPRRSSCRSRHSAGPSPTRSSSGRGSSASLRTPISPCTTMARRGRCGAWCAAEKITTARSRCVGRRWLHSSTRSGIRQARWP